MKYLFIFILFLSKFSLGQFDDARDFSNGLAALKTAGLWRFIDTNGKMVIDPQYLEVSDFQEGKAKVKTNLNNWRYIYNKVKIHSTKKIT